jgi:hypothetical protein
LWATQRLDEIRGFADTATVLRRGEARFAGTVAQLMAHAVPRRHLLHIDTCAPLAELRNALGDHGTLDALEPGHFALALSDGIDLGTAVAALCNAPVRVLACRQERSEIEDAFLSLVAEDPA